MEYERVIDEFGSFDGLLLRPRAVILCRIGAKTARDACLCTDIRNENLRELKPETGSFKGSADFYVDPATRRSLVALHVGKCRVMPSTGN